MAHYPSELLLGFAAYITADSKRYLHFDYFWYRTYRGIELDIA